MPFIKISQLTTATAVSATNQFEINQNGASRSAEVSVVAAYVRSSATNVLVLPAGSTASPALFPTGDTNTGIFFPAADTIAFTEGGVESMRLDASGNVGIGTSSPGARLDVAGNIIVRGGQASEGGEITLYNPDTTTIGVILDVSSADVTRWFTTRNNSLHQIGQLAGTGGVVALYTAGSERMRITAAGDVGIGTTSPDTSLGVNGGIRARGGAPGAGGVNNNGYSFGGGNGDTDGGMFSSADGQVEFYSNAVERARINAVGHFRIGTAGFIGAAESRLVVAGTSGATWSERTITIEHTSGNQPGIGFHAPTSSAAGIFKFYGPSNRFECRNNDDTAFIDIAANSCISISDYRLKENIAPFSGGLSAVMQLNPVTFKWRDKDRAAVGFVAHEVQAAIPTAITGVKDEMYDESTPAFQGIDPLQIVAVLTKAVQELTAKLEAAEARIANLENR